MSCVIGSWGWRHPEWEKDVFYPDDLPSDWRLSYYANEFDTVVVPASYWSADGYGDEDWLDDVTDVFRFYIDWPFLQMSTQAEYEKCAQYCQSLEQQLSAVLVNADIWSQLSSEQQQWFTTATKEIAVMQYSSMSGAEIEAEFTAVFNDQKSLDGESLLLLRSNATETLRELGGRLTELLKSSAYEKNNAETTLSIVLSNKVVEIQRLNELKTLLTLLVE